MVTKGLFCRSSDSTSLEIVPNIPQQFSTATLWDSDLDVDIDPPDWKNCLSEEELANLSPNEKKRQDVINGR